MTRTRALYAVVQYVPDGGRAEGANAGVVLYVPETKRVLVRTSPTLERVKKFFSPGKIDLKRIESAVKAFEYRMNNAQGEFAGEQEFSTFVAARANSVRMTAPKLVIVSDVMNDLNVLYAELVGNDGAMTLDNTKAANALVLPQRLAQAFAKLDAAGRLRKPGKIIIPGMDKRRKLKIPLAYKNGVVNYILPRSLATAKTSGDELVKLGFDGQLISKYTIDDEAGQLVVLSALPGALPDKEAEYAKVLGDFNVRFVRYRDNEAFAAEVEKDAH